MKQFIFSSTTNMQIRKALNMLNAILYSGQAVINITSSNHLRSSDNNDADGYDSTLQCYHAKIEYDLIYCDRISFYGKMDESGDIDFILFSPESNYKSLDIISHVETNGDFFGIKVKKIEESLEHRAGGGDPVKYFRLYI